jgi:hypothetical protein
MVNHKKMKTKYPLFLIIILFGGAACEIDNYEAPQFTLSGRIVDSQTNQLIESAGINAGTVVKLYENNSTQPLIYNTFPDGTFTNSKVFAGSYSYVAEGAFKMAEEGEQSIVIGENSQLEISVIPNLRLDINLAASDATTATLTVAYEKVAADQNLANLAVVWSKFRNPNNFTFAGGSILEENVESLDLTAGEKTFTITNLEPKTKYYIRASGRTSNPGNFYNYSTQIELQTP